MNTKDTVEEVDPEVAAIYEQAISLAQTDSDKRDMVNAAKLMEEAAERGHAMAQCHMGYLYTVGDGVEIDQKKAIEWLHKSSDQGIPQAMFNLARLYRVGSGVDQDSDKSLTLIRQAANLGHPESLHHLGIFYFAGEMGLEQDYKAAAVFFENASKAQYAPSLYSLGLCYSMGHGVEKDDQKAIGLYEAGARVGDTNAAFNLGLYHYYGQGGLKKDHGRAKELFRAAAAHGHPKAQAAYNSIEAEEAKEAPNGIVTSPTNNRKLHVFDNGVKVFDDQLLKVQRERYKLRNVHEEDEEDVFISLVKSLPQNGVYINVGAAIGYYPLLAKKLRSDLSIHCFEPLPSHLKFLRENIALNGYSEEDFQIHDLAISTQSGEANFVDQSYGSSLSNGGSHGTAMKPNHFTVKALALSEVFQEIGSEQIDLLQMDIQGYEEPVMAAYFANRNPSGGKIMRFLVGTHGGGIHAKCKSYLENGGYHILHNEGETKHQPDGILLGSLVPEENNQEPNKDGNIAEAPHQLLTSGQTSTQSDTKTTVWLASYPRSGNTFLRTALWHCFGLRSSSIYPRDLGGNKELEEYVGHIEHGPNIQKQFHETGISLIKTHEPPKDNKPAIYVIRDGRAACVSLSNFYKASLSLKTIIEGSHRFGTWSSHVMAWDPWNRPNTLIIEYEQLRNDLPSVLKSISEFLGKEILTTSIPDRNAIAQIDGQWVRKKTSWESKLFGADLEQFNQINKEILEKSGYL